MDIGDGLAVVSKVESHNHPSAVEPFQGAATGVGGIVRDILAMGARPIALLNSLRFGPLDDTQQGAVNRHLFGGVVQGISWYGNSITVPENTTSNLDRYSSTDPDQGDTVVWGISGTDADNFRIDSSGNLAFDGAPDYEMPGDSGGDNEYNIRVDAKDSSLTSSFEVTVIVTPVDEPPVITGRTTFNNWQENEDGTIETYTATDPEGDTNITWNLVGTDRGDFTITNGVLAFASAPDHERPADSGGNNHYEVTVRATDSNNKRGEQHIDVIVKNVDEPPVMTGPDTINDFPENASTSRQVGRYTATDPEEATV